MKILNLYAGIGGNRKLWGDEHEITAIEYKPQIAGIYQDNFPNDTVIVEDAHKYLLENFMNFDFIWSSPPCPSHSRVRFVATYDKKGNIRQKPLFPDMKLYEEIIFLQNYFRGKWCVENVVSYYEPLIRPQEIGRHYYWSNFLIPPWTTKTRGHYDSLEKLSERKGFDLSKYNLSKDAERLALRNCVEPEVAKHILKYATEPIKIQGELI